jgi:hypothetical protein
MSDQPCKEAVLEVLGYLEQVETRNRALARLLKAKAVITEEELESYMGAASNAYGRGQQRSGCRESRHPRPT